MNTGWTKVALGEVLTPRTEVCAINPETEYQEVTVSLWGKGVRLRRKVAGSAIAATSRNVARTGDFIISKIDARNGAYGFVPPALDGGVVTNDFPLFCVIEHRADPRWIYWVSRSRVFVDLCRASSEGSTNRVRLKESRFAQMRIPLPSLAEQRRLVAHLDLIEDSLTRARRLQNEDRKARLTLVTNLAHRRDLDSESKRKRGWQQVQLGAVLTRASDTVEVDSTASYPNLGIYSYGRGTFNKPPIIGERTSAKQLFRVRSGQFIYSRLFAFEGAYALVRPTQRDYYVSNEFPSFDLDARILPEFLFAYFKSPTVWTALAEHSTGLGNRRQRVHPDVILAHTIDLPPLDYQAKVRDAFGKLERARASSGGEEMDALLPSLLDRILKW